MNYLLAIIISAGVGAALTVATYETIAVPTVRAEVYQSEAVADKYFAQRNICSEYLGKAIERLEEYSATLDNCERRLMTCVGVKQ